MSMKKWLLCSICISLIWMTGCGNEIPDMTPQQSAMVSQYAANLLLMYSGNYENRLVDTSVEPEEERKPLSQLVQTPIATQEEDESQPEVENESQDQEYLDQEEIKEPTIPVATVLGLDGLDIKITGFEACESYPNDDSSDAMFFGMNAAPGNHLVVVHLGVNNTSSENVKFDTIGLNAKYRIILNGTDQHNTLITMLDNDFAAQNTVLEPSASMDTVLITEVPSEVATSLDKVALKVKNQDQETICE